MFINTISARFNKHNRALSCDMFHHNLELRKFLSEWSKHGVNKDLLSIENVNLLICYFPMNLTFVNMVGGVSEMKTFLWNTFALPKMDYLALITIHTTK